MGSGAALCHVELMEGENQRCFKGVEDSVLTLAP